MNELRELEEAAADYQRVWRSARFLGWYGASTVSGYVSEQDFYRIAAAGERWNKAITEAMRRAFA